ncbi:NB-ARC domain-containing protein [Amycolatopsis sp. VS8301801F10]|uniref:NB-ARC domain-containing protein n=1 Tax=Amycolatopsis sp. VS8301801F10 TaxID=2652442 RepID=UPI0038FBFC9A
MRALIENHILDLEDGEVFTAGEKEKIQGRRRGDRGASDQVSAAALLPYIDFDDASQILRRNSHQIPDSLSDQLDALKIKLARLAPVRNRVAHTRPMEIDDLPNTVDLCRELTRGSSQIYWPSLSEVVSKIESNPSYVLGLNVDLHSDPDGAPMHNLPIPDFDETGFFGRRKQIDRIKKIIKGAYPVVSVLGDGGIGKTAIALKVAYELLDDSAANFDAFVWVTAKAEQLTTSEIKRINGAIEDSLGLFAEAALNLGAQDAQDPLKEVLEYLEHFKVLLILDNMETVLDERLREFLLDIPMGSKVILTSRIGLGVENPVNLEPLTSDESKSLLYALARIREVPALRGVKPELMAKMSDIMGGRPAYIKWFVAGVQSGRRPEELLQRNDLFLEFCMSNVHQYLNSDARKILRCLQVLPGTRTHAELAYLADFDADKTHASLLDLLRTNFIQMKAQADDQEIGTGYELTEFGRSYLEKRHPVDLDERKIFQNRNKKLVELGKNLKAENNASPFDPITVSVRNPGEYSAARTLLEAIKSSQRGDYEAALGSCTEARRLSPGYFETWRVEGYVHAQSGDLTSATVAYEQAVELSPDHVSLNFFFGTFLIDNDVDVERGLRHLRVAARFDADNPLILNQIAWANLIDGAHEQVVDAVSHILDLRPSRTQGIMAMVVMTRAAVYHLRMLVSEKFVDRPVEFLENCIQVLEKSSVDFLIREPIDRLIQLADLSGKVKVLVEDAYHARKADEFKARIMELIRRSDHKALDRKVAKVKTVLPDKAFGFITMGSTDLFFHLRDLVDESQWEFLKEGGMATFVPDLQALRGPRAVEVAWID